MFLEIILLLLGISLCIVLGANNASACFGATFGGGFIKYSRAAGIAVLGVVSGTVIEGFKLSKTVSGEILNFFGVETVLAIIVSSFLVMVIATIFRLPMSLSEGVIGSAVGAGLGFGFNVNWNFLGFILLSWVIAPFLSAALSILIYKWISTVSLHVKNIFTLNYFYGKAALVLSFYLAYVLGANTVGLVNGIFNVFPGNLFLGALIFSSSTAFGMYFLSRRVTETVSGGITGLGVSTALSVQLSSAVTIHLLTQFSVPVSITQALIGGIFGVCLAKKIVFMRRKAVKSILVGWTVAPLIGMLIALGLASILKP